MNARRIRSVVALAAAAALAALAFTTAAADDAVAIGVDQVARGAATFAANCGFCHGAELQGGGFPPLAGPDFAARWSGRPVADLYDYARTQMPFGAAGSLAPEAYVDLVALILARNGVEPGDVEFTGADEAVLATPMAFAD